MCRSVPQIAVFSTLISTSFGPGTGTGTSSIQMPLPGSRLTSAFIVRDIFGPPWGKPRLYAEGAFRPGLRSPCDGYTRPDFSHVGEHDASFGQGARGRACGRGRGRPGGRGHVGSAAAPRNRRAAGQG